MTQSLIRAQVLILGNAYDETACLPCEGSSVRIPGSNRGGFAQFWALPHAVRTRIAETSSDLGFTHFKVWERPCGRGTEYLVIGVNASSPSHEHALLGRYAGGRWFDSVTIDKGVAAYSKAALSPWTPDWRRLIMNVCVALGGVALVMMTFEQSLWWWPADPRFQLPGIHVENVPPVLGALGSIAIIAGTLIAIVEAWQSFQSHNTRRKRTAQALQELGLPA